MMLSQIVLQCTALNTVTGYSSETRTNYCNRITLGSTDIRTNTVTEIDYTVIKS